MTRRIGPIFLIAFAFNYVWEHLHSVLYTQYQQGPITEFILMRATLGDAIYIALITLPFLLSPVLARRAWLIVPIGVAVSIAIEWHALATERWAYDVLMPIIPILQTGLTPTIQLGLLGYIAYRITTRQ